MGERNRRRLERLEQLAHVSLGDAQADTGAAIAMEAQLLDAQIRAFEGTSKAHADPSVWPQYGPDSHRAAMRAAHQRFKLSEPLAIKARFEELRQRVDDHGAGPSVRAVLARARAFVDSVA